MNYSTAEHQLRIALLLDFARQLNRNICFRCSKPIISPDDLSLDHKINWLDAENPKTLFFDIGNVALSHKKCNRPRPFTRVVYAQSGYKGVYYDKNHRGKKWCAQYQNIERKHINIGWFTTAKEAAIAYDSKLTEVYKTNPHLVTNKSLGLLGQ